MVAQVRGAQFGLENGVVIEKGARGIGQKALRDVTAAFGFENRDDYLNALHRPNIKETILARLRKQGVLT